jgi:hypothetical protein
MYWSEQLQPEKSLNAKYCVAVLIVNWPGSKGTEPNPQFVDGSCLQNSGSGSK